MVSRGGGGRNDGRMEKLLGISPSSHVSLLPSDSDEGDELREEDIWGDDTQVYKEPPVKEQADMPTRRPPGQRRWMGMSRDTGLAVAFAESSSSRSSRGLSALGPLTRISRDNTSPNPSASSSRPIVQASGEYRIQRLPPVAQSAPVKVPDWSKVLGNLARTKPVQGIAEEDDDDDDDSGGERLPPHELVARGYASSHSNTFSVVEGAGRTLKGRDASRVRNAVWRQTGFFG